MKVVRHLFAYLLIGMIGIAQADVGFDYKPPTKHPGAGILTIWLSGVVTMSDYEDITKLDGLIRQSLVAQKYAASDYGVLINLDSSGGSVETALAIGRYIRALKSSATSVWPEAKCYSSCVFILAGAPNRAVDGKVGIHRPYEVEDSNLTSAAQKKKYEKLGFKITTYLQEMNVPVRLYEDMLFISPERLKILSRDEQQKYGLNVNDPYYEEAEKAATSKKMGISRLELARREASLSAKCPDKGYSLDTPKATLFAYLHCREDVVNGVR